MEVEERYQRNIGVWDKTMQQKLWGLTLGFAGLGGAGCCAVDILVRNGVGAFKLADPGTYDTSNLQRQIFARVETLGRNKAEVARAHLLSINPELRVVAYPKGIDEHNVDEFLDGCDFVHETVDYFNPELKVLIHRKARERGILVTTTALIGSGVGGLVFHPEHMTFEEYFALGSPDRTRKQSFEELVRVKPDYLDKEIFLERVAKCYIPTSADAAYLAGIVTAGIYKRVVMGKPIVYAPSIIRLDLLDDPMYERAVLD